MTKTAKKFKAGDKVRVIRAQNENCADAWIKMDKNYGVNLGDFGAIKSIDNECALVDFSGNEHYMNLEQLELAPAEFKVGDRVRFICDSSAGGFRYGYKGFETTVLGVIGSNSVDIDGSGLACGFDPSAYTKDLELTPENTTKTTEAPKAPAPAIERKFKVGDRVARRGNQKDIGTIVGHKSNRHNSVEWDNNRGNSDTWQDHELELAKTPTTPAIVALIENGQPKPSSKPLVHETTEAATKEAERLAGKHPGQKFGVYQLVTARIGTVSVAEA